MDPFYIVAGNRNQFDNFVIRKRVLGFSYDFKYVHNAEMLRGLTKIRGFYIGDYEKRPDWLKIKEAILIIKWKEEGNCDEHSI